MKMTRIAAIFRSIFTKRPPEPVIDDLRAHPGTTVFEAADRLGIHWTEVHEHYGELLFLGLASRNANLEYTLK